MLLRWLKSKLNFGDARHPAAQSTAPGGSRESVIATKHATYQSILETVSTDSDLAVLDGLNEYDDDFSVFEPRGERVTHDLIRQVSRRSKGLSHPHSSAPGTSEIPVDDDPQGNDATG